MCKYRVVKRPMHKVIGSSTFYGYKYAFVIQKKGFFYGWNDVDYSVTSEHSHTRMLQLESGILTNSLDEVV